MKYINELIFKNIDPYFYRILYDEDDDVYGFKNEKCRNKRIV